MDVDTAAIAVAAFNGDNKLFFSSFRLCFCCSVKRSSARVSSEDMVLMRERVDEFFFYDDKALSSRENKKENHLWRGPGQCDDKIHKKREETKKREKKVSFFYHIQKSHSLSSMFEKIKKNKKVRP